MDLSELVWDYTCQKKKKKAVTNAYKCCNWMNVVHHVPALWSSNAWRLNRKCVCVCVCACMQVCGHVYKEYTCMWFNHTLKGFSRVSTNFIKRFLEWTLEWISGTFYKRNNKLVPHTLLRNTCIISTWELEKVLEKCEKNPPFSRDFSYVLKIVLHVYSVYSTMHSMCFLFLL